VFSPVFSHTPPSQALPIQSRIVTIVDGPIDRLVGDSQPGVVGKIELHPADNLIGRPVLLESLVHILANLRPLHLLRPRLMPPLLAQSLSSDRAILPPPAEAMGDAVAPELTRDRRFSPTEQHGNPPFGDSLAVQPRYLNTLFRRKMIVGHRWDSIRTPFHNTPAFEPPNDGPFN